MVDNYVDGVLYPGSGGTEYALKTPTDTTISVEGEAADAKAVGDAITNLTGQMNSRIDAINNGTTPYWDEEVGLDDLIITRSRTIPDSFPVPTVGDLTLTKNGVLLRVTAVSSSQVTYTVVNSVITDDTLSKYNAPADAKVVGDALATKAEVDGSYDSMTVGNAEQLISTVYEEDSVPYKFRTSGGSIDIGDREEDKIIGGTVAWNQLADFSLFPSAANGITYSSTDGKSVTFSGTANAIETRTGWFRISEARLSTRVGHNILLIPKIISGSFENGTIAYSLFGSSFINFSTPTIRKVGVTQYTQRIGTTVTSGTVANNFTVTFICIDLTQLFGSTIADYIYSLETANEGAGVAWFRKLFPKPYYAYNPGELLSVSDLESHDMVGFNAWDEEWEVGSINASTGQNSDATGRIRTTNYIKVIPSANYYVCMKDYTGTIGTIALYDANKTFIEAIYEQANSVLAIPANTHYLRIGFYVNYGGTYKNDICINLHWDGERDGEYEPYKKWSYPLDDSLTLRGIPKLDADNKLYYDGDVYEPDGTVTRKYGIVDLGTLDWVGAGANKLFYTAGVASEIRKSSTNNDVFTWGITTNGLTPMSYNQIGTSTPYSICVSTAGNILATLDVSTAYADAAAFKTAMSGVYLVYELATPTTESADPYQNPQIVDDFGTEEYVTTSIVPVGHETKYQPNLRAKLEMAPNSPDGNGDYIVRHTNGENVYVPLSFPADELPPAPTEDGTYRLTVTVSNGTATYAWVSA